MEPENPDETMAKKAKNDAARNEQLTRLLKIIRDLDRLDGVDLYELADRYGTTVRTIRRDFDALQAVGLPLVEEQDGKRKRWRVEFRDHLRRLGELVDVSHYVALQVAMGQAGPLAGRNTLFSALEDLSDKIEKVLGEKERKQLALVNSAFHFREKAAYQKAPPDVLWPLVQAISERRICRVRYRAPSGDGAKSYRILPLRIFVNDGAPYLLAHVVRHERVILLNLQRLESLDVSSEVGKITGNFDPKKWEESAFDIYSGGPPVDFELIFSPKAATYIRERSWHPTQKLTDLADGSLCFTFTCSESYEVTSWVTRWQKDVEVKRPESLKKLLADYGSWLAKRYAPQKSSSA